MINAFEKYLRQQAYRPSSIREYARNVREFLVWAEEQCLHARKVSYNDMTSYVNFLQRRIDKPQTINVHLGNIAVFFKHLMKAGKRKDNPVTHLRLKGSRKTVVANLLSEEDLMTLFQLFSNYKPRQKPSAKEAHQRHTIILGLMIFQGLTSSELQRLLVADFHLDTGTVHVPECPRSRARILPLYAHQVIPLTRYFETFTSEKLIDVGVNDLLYGILKKLNKQRERKYKAQDIRSSRIVLWIQQYGLRKAQYYSGMKYLSSLEKYRVQDIRTLQKEVERFHPMA
jgi:site-specific recombinase XerD